MRTSTVLSLILATAVATPALARPLGEEGVQSQAPVTTNREGYVPHPHVPHHPTEGPPPPQWPGPPPHRRPAHHHTGGQAPHIPQAGRVHLGHPEVAHTHVAHARAVDSNDAQPHGMHPHVHQGAPDHRRIGLQTHKGFRTQGPANHWHAARPQEMTPSTAPAQTSRVGKSSGHHADHELLARGFDSDEELLARAIGDELVARKVNWKKVGSTAATVAGDVGKFLLHCAGARIPIVRPRLRRGYFPNGVGKFMQRLPRSEDPELFSREFDEELFARALNDELVARKVNWKSEDPELFSREFDEELFARALNDELVARKVNWKKVGSTAATVAGDVGKLFFHLRRDEDPELFERGYDDYSMMMERGMELDELD
ncbi:uncharacterized protein B0H18DRAFT_956999 [Fomitopsis serialis]|uniref:uncharacterized protein n=1 Tax=Fomitopsis serialis TaxID=139415 RepID=UPI00200806EC|nr:uncharacterized protein B0H18DRAFT_956999 [Neoantrodia serialis]KAH9920615.1 hypothetical protein B0H18DRAFT_956999 [Neoantrodia serialis]